MNLVYTQISRVIAVSSLALLPLQAMSFVSDDFTSGTLDAWDVHERAGTSISVQNNRAVIEGIDSLTQGGQAAFLSFGYDNSQTQYSSFRISFVMNFEDLALDMSTPQKEESVNIFQHRIAEGNRYITQLQLVTTSWWDEVGLRMENRAHRHDDDRTSIRYDALRNPADVLQGGDLLFEIYSSTLLSGPDEWTNSASVRVTRLSDSELLFDGTSSSVAKSISSDYNPLTSDSHYFQVGYGPGRGDGGFTWAHENQLSGSISIDSISVIPEPSTYALLFGLGVAGCVFLFRSRPRS